jgi:cytochrome c peroxidase
MPINRNPASTASAVATPTPEGLADPTSSGGSSGLFQVALGDPNNPPLGFDGIALSSDGKTAYVYSQLAHTLFAVDQSNSESTLQVANSTQLETDILSPDQVAGRQMFYSALDSRMTGANVGIACISCHLEGREDGHVWQFPDGPRQTPSLAGRQISQTAPYHWAGIFPTLSDFYSETITNRMGGSGLNSSEAAQLTSYIETIPSPENPFQNRPDLAASQARGQLAFQKAGCTACHKGDAMTDNQLHDVGTLTATDLLEHTELVNEGPGVPSQVTPVGFSPLMAVNTPSLMGLARTAPYLHDGSVPTVQARIDQSRTENKHGDTSQLTSDEVSDLTAYLYSL